MGVRVSTKRGQAKVARFQGKLDRVRILTRIGERLKDWMQTNFLRQGRGAMEFGRGGWEPIAANTKLKEGWRAPLTRTGKLQQSVFFDLTTNGVRAGYSDNKASYHHFGTRPHTITPKRAQFLRFPTATGEVFAKSVNHPGTPARHLLPKRVQAKNMAIIETKKEIREE